MPARPIAAVIRSHQRVKLLPRPPMTARPSSTAPTGGNATGKIMNGSWKAPRKCRSSCFPRSTKESDRGDRGCATSCWNSKNLGHFTSSRVAHTLGKQAEQTG